MNFKYSDVFITNSSKSDLYILYAPLRRRAFYVNEIAKNDIFNYINGDLSLEELPENVRANIIDLNSAEIINVLPENIHTTNKAVILLTQKCNMACSYCYASEAHCQDTMTFDMAKKIVDYVLSGEMPTNKSFTFIGGGEPTVEWELFENVVRYIIDKNNNYHKLQIGLTTNGTLLNTQRIMWLKDNNIRVGLSFDILPQVQNYQRPLRCARETFDIVDKAIQEMISCQLIPNIRSTITESNVSLMPEMVEFVVDHYPQIKTLHFEHVSIEGDNSSKYYADFVKYFFEAKEIAFVNSITLKNSITTSMKSLRHNFCNGEFCISPLGDVVACHRVSSKEDLFFDKFLYGTVSKAVQIDEIRLNDFYELSRTISGSCENCFARWNCAGACTYNRMLYGNSLENKYCQFVQSMVISELEFILNNQ